MLTEQLNNQDIEILSDAVRVKESEIKRLRSTPIADFETETKILNEIQNRQAVIKAYRRLINIHRSKFAAVQTN